MKAQFTIQFCPFATLLAFLNEMPSYQHKFIVRAAHPQNYFFNLIFLWRGPWLMIGFLV